MHAYIYARRGKQEQSKAKNMVIKNLSISHGRQVSALCNNFRNALHYEYGVQGILWEQQSICLQEVPRSQSW